MSELAPVLTLNESSDDQEIASRTLQEVIESRTFEKTPALRSLLNYLWQHRLETVSEYAVATEALGRPASFDSRTDATVRVQISRLRQRLERFYDDEGRYCSQRLVIPLGSHQLHFERVTHPVKQELAPVTRPVPVEATRRRAVPLLAFTAATLLVLCFAQGWRLHTLSNAPRSAPKLQIPWFWKNFFANGKSTRVTLPTPVFFSFPHMRPEGNAAVMLRDTSINEFADGGKSRAFNTLEKMLGHPALAENYTVTSDTFACIQLTRYLDRFSLPASVHSMADAPMDALDSENLIAVGTWGTLTPLKPYLDRMDFELGAHEEFVTLRRPGVGESSIIRGDTESPDRGIWPGVIAVVPSKTGQTKLLLLASRYTAALVSLLTSSNGLDQLAKIWTANGSPEYFQVVVKAEISGRGLVRYWPVVLHPYRARTP